MTVILDSVLVCRFYVYLCPDVYAELLWDRFYGVVVDRDPISEPKGTLVYRPDSMGLLGNLYLVWQWGCVYSVRRVGLEQEIDFYARRGTFILVW